MTIPLITTPPSVADLVSIYNQLVRLINASGGGGGSGTVTTGGSLTADVLPKATGAAEISDSNYADHGDGSATIDILDEADDLQFYPGLKITFDADAGGVVIGPADATGGYAYLDMLTYGGSTPAVLSLAYYGGVEGSPAPAGLGLRLGEVDFIGGTDNAGAYGYGASIYAAAAENFTAGSTGGTLHIQTTEIGDGAAADRIVISGAGNTSILNGVLTIESHAPAAANSAGIAGTITWEAGFLYVCTATNTWERVATATWP